MWLDHGRSSGVAAGAHDRGERPKLGGPPLALFRRGLEVPKVPQSEDPAAPASSHTPSPSRKKKADLSVDGPMDVFFYLLL